MEPGFDNILQGVRGWHLFSSQKAACSWGVAGFLLPF